MRLALDTNRYVDFARGDPATVEVLDSAEEIHLPLIVLGDLRAGFAVGAHGARNEGGLRRFLLRPGASVLAPDEQTTHHYAMVYRQLRHQGTPIPTNDMWIAALVIQHGLVFSGRDAHFDHLPPDPTRLIGVRPPPGGPRLCLASPAPTPDVPGVATQRPP